MRKTKDTEKYDILCHKNKIYCKNCKHSTIVLKRIDSFICSHCKHRVFTSEKSEFEFNLKQALKK